VLLAIAWSAGSVGVPSRALSAQTPAAPQSTALVLGQIVDADTGKPVSAATVILTLGIPSTGYANAAENILFPQTPPGAAPPTRVVVGSDGRFVFRDLAKGRYGLAVSAAGYVPGVYGQARAGGSSLVLELGDGEKLRDVTIRLWKPAVLNGIVVDESGDPVVGMTVRAMRRTIAGGKPRWTFGSSAFTDDRGAYRIANLIPGDYIVGVVSTQTTTPTSAIEAFAQASASGGPAGSVELQRELASSGARSAPPSGGFRVGDLTLQASDAGTGRTITSPAPTDDGRVFAYPATFAPEARTLSQAAVFTLGSGEDRRGADVQLRLMPTERVSGSVIGPSGPIKNLNLRLLPSGLDEFAAESGIEAATTLTDATGAFAFLGVAAGQYTLKTSKVPLPPLAAPRMPDVMVGGSGGVSFGTGTAAAPAPPPVLPADPTLWAVLTVAVGDADVTGLAVTLKAGLRVSGRLEFTGSKEKPTADQLQRLAVTLSPLGVLPGGGTATGRVSPDGQFNSQGYPPGDYLVSASALPGWTFVSAMRDGRDVSDQPLEITASDISGIVITLTDRPTDLSGSVRTSLGAIDADADVIVFPANHDSWKAFGINPRRARSTRTTKAGAYTFSGLPPGDYYLAAVGAASSAEWQDPKFLDTLVRVATRVSLGDGEKKTVDVVRR
jgi:hypothetical protein